jgi:phage gpG-like protein
MSDLAAAFDVDAVGAALAGEAEILREALEERIRAKLSGDVLRVRSGALLNSISVDVEDDGAGLTLTAGSSGVPYAAILEYGGKTAAHDIVAVKGKALAFVVGGQKIFAKSVHHPGSLIRAYAYLSSSLEEAAADIEIGLKEAVLAALGAE